MTKLQTFNIKGERCSGTSYLKRLIHTNLNIKYIQDRNVGWKHGYFSLFNEYENPPSTFLTIVIFRNVFDWVRSFYLRPHHLKNTYFSEWIKPEPTFSEFIRTEIIETEDFDHKLGHTRHPLYLTHPKNVFELRKWKTEHFLNLKNILPNVYYLKYEDLIEDPEKIVTEINNKYFNINFKFKNWEQYKESDKKYIPKKYFDISHEDMLFLIQNVDWDLESKLGYSFRDIHKNNPINI